MTINSINIAIDTMDNLVQDAKSIEKDSNTEDLAFEETFKDVFDKKNLEEGKEKLEDESEDDENIKTIENMGIQFLNIPIEIRENNFCIGLDKGELIEEDNREDLKNIEVNIKNTIMEDLEIVEDIENTEVLEKAYIGEEVLKDDKTVSTSEVKEEKKVGKNKNISLDKVKKEEEVSDIKEVKKEEKINLDDLEGLEVLEKAEPIDIEDIKTLEKDIDSIFDNEHTYIRRNIPKMDIRNFPVKEIHQLPKENIEIVNNSIIKLMETGKDGDTSTMKVKLYPEELGNVDVLLTMNESKLEVKIIVQNQNIKDMFNENISKFNQSFEKQNINLQGFSVDVNQDFNKSQDERERNNRQRKNDKAIRISNGSLVDKAFNKGGSTVAFGAISILA